MSLIALLVVQLSTLRVALAAGVVRRIVAAATIAPLPDAPAIVEGVVNVRGFLLPVLDVRRRFGLPPLPLDPDHHFVIADAGSKQVAIRVDRALDVIYLPADAFESINQVVPGMDQIAGLARLPDGILVVHNLERFLSLQEARALDDALSAAG